MCTKDNFFAYLKNRKFYYRDEIVINFLLSLKVKPFVILTGNSGTGKTKLSQLFAEYVSEKYDNKQNMELIPVGANWTENKYVVGFYNVLTKEYHSTSILDLMLNCEEGDCPYFLILDEMNLSHVERYFSDFLSALESNEEIPLHNCSNELLNKNENLIPNRIEIPKNLFIIGTVNIDETTYMFSPKVLDRANIIEFETFSKKDEDNGLSIKNYMFDDFDYAEILDYAIEYLEDPFSDKDLRDDFDINNLKTKFDNETIWIKLCDELTKFNDSLKKSNFDFGFRAVNEILLFMYVAKEFEKRNNDPAFTRWEKYFDVQIKQKILPKLHGSTVILDTLNELLGHCSNEQDESGNSVSYKYETSAKKINDMIKLLEKQKYVSFIN